MSSVGEHSEKQQYLFYDAPPRLVSNAHCILPRYARLHTDKPSYRTSQRSMLLINIRTAESLPISPPFARRCVSGRYNVQSVLLEPCE